MNYDELREEGERLFDAIAPRLNSLDVYQREPNNGSEPMYRTHAAFTEICCALAIAERIKPLASGPDDRVAAELRRGYESRKNPLDNDLKDP